MTTVQQQTELEWLLDNPHFEERPASLEEFLGPSYLNLSDFIRPGVYEVLQNVIGEEPQVNKPTLISKALSTGAIGIGKSTLAAIILCYVTHWTLCLKEPQAFFSLMPGSRIAFAMTATRKEQAKEVVFMDMKAMVSNSLWFQKYPFDKAFKNQMRFPKNVWIVPGDSTETGFEGYNILGYIMDEMDSYKQTTVKDYAQAIMTTLDGRTKSRFGSRGFGILIGQMKSQTGFANEQLERFQALGHYTNRMTLWDSHGWDAYADPEKEDLYVGVRPDGSAKRFYYDRSRSKIIPPELVEDGYVEVDEDNIMSIPMVYFPDFDEDPVKALRDLAGIPPKVGDPFITLTDRIAKCAPRWHEEYGPDSPFTPEGKLIPGFRAQNSIPRVLHIDIGYAPGGDALGMAMGHVAGMRTMYDGEQKPFIVFDFLGQWTAKSGNEIDLSDIRTFIYHLKFELGFKIKQASLDGYQSVDFMQQLERRGKIPTEYVSVDTTKGPYHDLKDAIYENRIAWPRYMVKSRRPGSADLIDLPFSELSQLVDKGHKVDHTTRSTKDLADAMAAVTSVLMGDRRYHRRQRTSPPVQPAGRPQLLSGTNQHHAYVGPGGQRAPRPPSRIGRRQ